MSALIKVRAMNDEASSKLTDLLRCKKCTVTVPCSMSNTEFHWKSRHLRCKRCDAYVNDIATFVILILVTTTRKYSTTIIARHVHGRQGKGKGKLKRPRK